MFFKTPYNYDTDLHSFTSGLDCSKDPSRAQQHMKEETDINLLVKTFARTGIIPGQDLPAVNFEMDEIFDYQSAMNQIRKSQEAFDRLPSNVREYFHNDPNHLLKFVSDENNRAEAERLGLAIKKQPAQPVNTGGSQNPVPVKDIPAE